MQFINTTDILEDIYMFVDKETLLNYFESSNKMDKYIIKELFNKDKWEFICDNRHTERNIIYKLIKKRYLELYNNIKDKYKWNKIKEYKTMKIKKRTEEIAKITTYFIIKLKQGDKND